MMRDRETDSWWSIMQSKAIDGALSGTSLQETSWGEKVQWGDWVERHPETKVLSVKGKTHEPKNPYESYFESAKTFRDIAPEDDRLDAKEAIFAFRRGGEAYVIPHRVINGGRSVALDTEERLYFWRDEGASVFETTFAVVLPSDLEHGATEEQLRKAVLESRASGREADVIVGFDTYWYNWAPQNPNTVILGP